MKILFYLMPFLLFPCFYYYYTVAKKVYSTPSELQSWADSADLFPSDPEILKKRVQKACHDARQALDCICSVEPTKRTFDNTLRALDLAADGFHSLVAVLEVLSLVSPDESLRNASQEALIGMQSFVIDFFSSNKRLYAACSEYEHLLQESNVAQNLSEIEKYFLEETMDEFRRNGLQLSCEQQEKLKNIQKELSQQILDFDMALSSSNDFIGVKLEELGGIDRPFLDTLKKTDKGLYRIGADLTSVIKILGECTTPSTRKNLYRKHMQRGYPENVKRLEKVLELRHQLAVLLGYPSYAHYEIANQMAKTPERVSQFIEQIYKHVMDKALQEVKSLKRDIPKDVKITSDGRFYPWDLEYVLNYHKKKYLQIDESEIANYFPSAHTLPAILQIFETFFGLSFKKVANRILWSKDIECLAVYRGAEFIGTVYLDLFPRPFKYKHAGVIPIIPARRTLDGKLRPSVAYLIANFPQAQENKPALLKRIDVITFFHEFGHVIHVLLGATQFASFSGLNTKTDFLEMPSQMLEEWAWQPVILKKISSHYLTGESLPGKVIERLKKIKNLDSGSFAMMQLFLTAVSLESCMPEAGKNIAGIWKDLYKKMCTTLVFDPKNHGYCSFEHLMGYGSKYYGYIWSKVFALDLFNYIKQDGLLDPNMGERYIKEVLSKGGSQEPDELLRNFLGREPNAEAFFNDLCL